MSPPSQQRRSIVVRAIAMIATAGIIVGAVIWSVHHFSNHRSTTAYCRMWVDEGTKLQQESNASIQQAQQNGDPFGALGFAMGSPRELADFFGRLDAVAPDQIEPAIGQLHQAFQQTADNLGGNSTDPIGFLGAQFSIMMIAGPYEQQVATWNQTNCPATLTR